MYDKKYKEWFIEINQGAECYPNVLDIVKDMNVELYGLIKHDRDIYSKEDQEKNAKYVAGKPKTEHLHLALSLVNPITEKSARNHFKGAHVDIMKYKVSCYQYLIHKNHPNKAQYNPNEIITNNRDLLNEILNSDKVEYEVFIESKVFDYLAEGVVTATRFLQRFGLLQYKKWWKGAYQDFVEDRNRDSELNEIIRNLQAQKTEIMLQQNKVPYEIEETGEIIDLSDEDLPF